MKGKSYKNEGREKEVLDSEGPSVVLRFKHFQIAIYGAVHWQFSTWDLEHEEKF